MLVLLPVCGCIHDYVYVVCLLGVGGSILYFEYCDGLMFIRSCGRVVRSLYCGYNYVGCFVFVGLCIMMVVGGGFISCC